VAARRWRELEDEGRCHRCGKIREAKRIDLTRCFGCAKLDAEASKERRRRKKLALPAGRSL